MRPNPAPAPKAPTNVLLRAALENLLRAVARRPPSSADEQHARDTARDLLRAPQGSAVDDAATCSRCGSPTTNRRHGVFIDHADCLPELAKDLRYALGRIDDLEDWVQWFAEEVVTLKAGFVASTAIRNAGGRP